MPMRDAYRDGVRNKLQDKAWRDMAYGAVELLESEDLTLEFNMANDTKTVIKFMDIYCQAFRNDLVTFEDKVLIALAWQDIVAGRLIYTAIQAGEAPHADDMIEENKGILKDMVAHYQERNTFDLEDADFWAGTQGADGFIKFKSPIIKGPGVALDADGNHVTETLIEKNGVAINFPLEVGYCLPDQMEDHLRTSGCVARFPYDYNMIIFLESTKPKPSLKLQTN